MKRANQLIERIADPDNLRLACWKAAKGKRYNKQVLAYQEDLDKNLLLLRNQILSGEIDVGNYHYFKIYDPKERNICASAFKEQVLHHALMNICHEYFERKQIFDSYACRKGKGTYAALERAKKFTKRFTYYLKLDVKKYFASIDHQVLNTQLSRMFRETDLGLLLSKIIDSYEDSENRGLPIGNLGSQYFANHFLSGLDHYIKEKLRIKGYLRYMDDMILWHDDKLLLKQVHEEVNYYLKEQLSLDLKPGQLNKSEKGLPFLGYIVFPYNVKLARRSKRRFIKKMKEIEAFYQAGIWDETECQRKGLSLLAFTTHANAKNWRRIILKQQ
jgi:RNA-directed DNA polymerase